MAAEILFCAAGSREDPLSASYRELTRIVSEAARPQAPAENLPR